MTPDSCSCPFAARPPSQSVGSFSERILGEAEAVGHASAATLRLRSGSAAGVCTRRQGVASRRRRRGARAGGQGWNRGAAGAPGCGRGAWPPSPCSRGAGHPLHLPGDDPAAFAVGGRPSGGGAAALQTKAVLSPKE